MKIITCRHVGSWKDSESPRSSITLFAIIASTNHIESWTIGTMMSPNHCGADNKVVVCDSLPLLRKPLSAIPVQCRVERS